jgi:eukaryotic-like serine/threonine-protein kinase
VSAQLSSPDLNIGRVVAGKYRIDSLIGEGSMGSVYAAEQIALRKPVAIKVMHRELAADRSFAERFNHEAQATSRLSHSNSILVTDFGEDTDGLLYLVMERVVGKSLDSLIVNEPLMSEQRVALLMAQALSALAVAHDAGIVHRDLKPENMLVVEAIDDDGNAVDVLKVCDFGIASMLTNQMAPVSNPAAAGMGSSIRRGARLTAVGSIIGTPAYMSPEQAQGLDSDSRSDLYSIGVVLYELLTGQIPFTADRVEDIAMKQVTDTPVAPSKVRPGIAPELEAICLRALEKAPHRRFESARDMRSALRDFALSQSEERSGSLQLARISQRALADTLDVAQPVKATVSIASESPRTPSSRTRALVVFAGLASIAGMGAFAWPRSQANVASKNVVAVQQPMVSPLVASETPQPLASILRRTEAPLTTSLPVQVAKATASIKQPEAKTGNRVATPIVPEVAEVAVVPQVATVAAVPMPTVAPPQVVAAVPEVTAVAAPAFAAEKGRVTASVGSVNVIARGDVKSMLSRINFDGCYQTQLRALGRAETGNGTIKLEFDEAGRARVLGISLPPALKPAGPCLTARIQGQIAKAPDTATPTADISLVFGIQ